MAALAQENLLPLPQRLAVEHLLGEVRMVSRDGVVSWGGACYGVPWPYAGRRLVVKWAHGLRSGSPVGASPWPCTLWRLRAGRL